MLNARVKGVQRLDMLWLEARVVLTHDGGVYLTLSRKEAAAVEAVKEYRVLEEWRKEEES